MDNSATPPAPPPPAPAAAPLPPSTPVPAAGQAYGSPAPAAGYAPAPGNAPAPGYAQQHPHGAPGGYTPYAAPGGYTPHAAPGTHSGGAGAGGFSLDGVSSKELLRYFLYLMNFIFGTVVWGTVADKGKAGGVCAIDKSVFSEFLDIDLTSPVEPTKNSALCDVVIAFGVLLFLLLLAIIAWHTLKYFNIGPKLDDRLEALLFAGMSLCWFILFIVLVARIPSIRRNNSSEARSSIACAFMAGLTHAASAVIAFLSSRDGENAKSPEAPFAPTTAPASA